jgi:NADH-quinone oxidoreductase subunit L
VFAGSAAFVHAHHLEASTEWILMGTATVLILIVILYAITTFKKYTTTEPNTGIAKVLENKWYIDELYDNIIRKPLDAISSFFSSIFEHQIVDGLVRQVSHIPAGLGSALKLVQNGKVAVYILMMIIGLIAILFTLM